MSFSTYTEYQNASSSQKVTLAIIEPARRLVGWILDSGSTYTLSSFSDQVILSVQDSGTALVEASSSSLSSGEYFHDRSNAVLYLRTSDDADPNTKFIVMFFREYFADQGGVALPNDLASSYDVEFKPLIEKTSEFGVSLNNRSGAGFGIAIEGKGNISFSNDFSYWSSRYDKFAWENKRVFIYSWSPTLPVSEAKLIYRGRITRKSWTSRSIRFQLKDFISEIKNPLDLQNIEDLVIPFKVSDDLLLAKQRAIYGYVFGMVGTPIDMVVEGFDATGTIDLSTNSATVTGTGTSFLSQLSPDDVILVGDFDGATVESIASDTSLTLTSEWENANQSGVTYKVSPDRPKRFKNRKFLIAGHKTREPSTTVVSSTSLRVFTVVDATDILAGDEIKVGSEIKTVESVSSNVITLTQNLVLPAVPSTAVVRNSVSNVFINADQLTLDRDYTYDADTGVLTLDDEAEVNVSPLRAGVGTVAWGTGSRIVTGTGTNFVSQIRSSDFISAVGTTEFLEVLSVESDTSLTVRTTPVAVESGAALQFKSPEYFDENESRLILDAIGKTKDGTKSGELTNTASRIVESLLDSAGLSSFVDTSSFDTADELAAQRVGLIVPDKFDSTRTKKIREYITEANESVLGSLVQNEDFSLEYQIISPERSLSTPSLDESDVLKFSIKADISKIIKKALVNYKFVEAEPSSLNPSNSQELYESNEGLYLTETNNELEVDSLLADQTNAQTIAERYAFLLQIARGTIDIDTKLQAARLQVTDSLQIDHQKLYERIGSSLNRKVTSIEKLTKSGNAVSITAEDLGNAYSRSGIITEDDANEFNNASDNELMVDGYITDDSGMIDNDADTFNINLIW